MQNYGRCDNLEQTYDQEMMFNMFSKWKNAINGKIETFRHRCNRIIDRQ